MLVNRPLRGAGAILWIRCALASPSHATAERRFSFARPRGRRVTAHDGRQGCRCGGAGVCLRTNGRCDRPRGLAAPRRKAPAPAHCEATSVQSAQFESERGAVASAHARGSQCGRVPTARVTDASNSHACKGQQGIGQTSRALRRGLRSRCFTYHLLALVRVSAAACTRRRPSAECARSSKLAIAV